MIVFSRNESLKALRRLQDGYTHVNPEESGADRCEREVVESSISNGSREFLTFEGRCLISHQPLRVARYATVDFRPPPLPAQPLKPSSFTCHVRRCCASATTHECTTYPSSPLVTNCRWEGAGSKKITVVGSDTCLPCKRALDHDTIAVPDKMKRYDFNGRTLSDVEDSVHGKIDGPGL